jgi:hypothetical protein
MYDVDKRKGRKLKLIGSLILFASMPGCAANMEVGAALLGVGTVVFAWGRFHD